MAFVTRYSARAFTLLAICNTLIFFNPKKLSITKDMSNCYYKEEIAINVYYCSAQLLSPREINESRRQMIKPSTAKEESNKSENLRPLAVNSTIFELKQNFNF